MNKEDKITFDDLANWLDKPLSNNDIDLINFILTSIENRYKHLELQQKVNQLETKINTYENPEDMTLMFMWCDEKAKDKIKQLETNIADTIIEIKKRSTPEVAQLYIEILERGKYENN